ncbi:MAG: hypothetical protein BWY00_01733 [Firmicutes bacterium ADurb.Bin153]|nr:MAG: hypothetical protein BWY00_01733 [Firmicutes bacterium ADurb.Bin153]
MAISEKDFIRALEKNGGWTSQTAKALGVSHQAVRQRLLRNKKLMMKQQEIKEMYLDLAESKVVKAVNDGAAWAICFYLKCQGKHRGWIETVRNEHSGPDGGPIQTEDKKPDYSKLSKDELRQLHELYEKLYAKD